MMLKSLAHAVGWIYSVWYRKELSSKGKKISAIGSFRSEQIVRKTDFHCPAQSVQQQNFSSTDRPRAMSKNNY